MIYSKSVLFLFSLTLAIAFCSCRKKDRRYEGTYRGIEHYTYQDSGATVYSVDTTYFQEVIVTYENAFLPRRKRYKFLKTENNPYGEFTLGKNEFEDGAFVSMYTGATMTFIGDSLYIYTTNFSDYIENWDTEIWEFRGKRN